MKYKSTESFLKKNADIHHRWLWMSWIFWIISLLLRWSRYVDSGSLYVYFNLGAMKQDETSITNLSEKQLLIQKFHVFCGSAVRQGQCRPRWFAEQSQYPSKVRSSRPQQRESGETHGRHRGMIGCPTNVLAHEMISHKTKCRDHPKWGDRRLFSPTIFDKMNLLQRSVVTSNKVCKNKNWAVHWTRGPVGLAEGC